MDELIGLENLIEQAKEQGINFGKGDPYNRLRYYTKIGWLPHMVRKKDAKGYTRGHYPIWAMERLVEIETLKAKGATNDDISKKLKVKTGFQNVFGFLKSKETRNQAIFYTSFIILVLILLNEAGVVRLGKSKAYIPTPIANDTITQFVDKGSAFIPKNQNKLFVQSTSIQSNHKVYVTFTQNYSAASRYWVSNIQDNKGFLVELDAPVFNNTEFNWWITN